MLAVILGGVFTGHWIDTHTGWRFPVLTTLFTILAVVLAIYLAIKDLLK